MRKRKATLALLLIPALLGVGAAARVMTRAAEAGGGRIIFRVTAEEEGPAGRKPLFEATVEGPPGTDFTVNLQDPHFTMRAKFLSDPEPDGGLRLRSKLDTRRLYGHSERGLPLYEEDSQSQALRLGLGDSVLLLPFGGDEEARLAIRITPERAGGPATPLSGEKRPPEIKIGLPSPGGVISVEALKVPHDFAARATLLEDGREVARGAAECLLEESGEITLRPNAGGSLALALTVERFEPGPGKGRAAVRFDLLDGGARGGGEAFARNWAGQAGLGSEMVYDLTGVYPGAAGKKYELKLKIDLADGE